MRAIRSPRFQHTITSSYLASPSDSVLGLCKPLVTERYKVRCQGCGLYRNTVGLWERLNVEISASPTFSNNLGILPCLFIALSIFSVCQLPFSYFTAEDTRIDWGRMSCPDIPWVCSHSPLEAQRPHWGNTFGAGLEKDLGW